MPLWFMSLFWGLLGGAALILGAAVGYFARVQQRMIAGGAVSVVTVAAVFLSNIPEGLSSSAGMKQAGRSKAYVFGVWSAIAIISGFAALVGYTVFRHFDAGVIAATVAVAAGAILS